jgi:hypothetical protein
MSITITSFGVVKKATVTVADHESLRALWVTFNPITEMMVGSITVEKPLTSRELHRLPRDLRAKLA